MRWRDLWLRPRLTIAVPLHNAGRWTDLISANLALMPSDARIVLSDETRTDDALDHLQTRHRGDRRLLVRRRQTRAGWREHANALIRETRTDLFSLLPQDDAITPGYYEKLIRALDACPSAGVAFGVIDTVGLSEGTAVQRLAGPPIELGRRAPWMEAIELDRTWNLGVPYRGVVRTRLMRPIPPTQGDRFADQIWVFSLALAAHLVQVPDAVYVKNYHPANTHSAWPPLSGTERAAALEVEIRERLSYDPAAMRAALDALRTSAPPDGANNV